MDTKRPSETKSTTDDVANKNESYGDEPLVECGGYTIHTNGNQLIIQADEDVSLEFQFSVTGPQCRSNTICRIVHGQWEC